LFSVAVLAIFGAPLLWSVAPARADSTAMDALVDGNTAFALDLYGQLKSGEGNLFLSPYSISTALAMTYAGARGDTAKQMSEVLHFTLDKEQLHSAFARLEAQLNGVRDKGNIELRVANALWADQDYLFLDEFLELVTKNYQAELRYADFKTAYEAAREEINAWVEGQTNGKIKDLLQRGVLDSLTRLVLANAIYFKGMWMSQFEESATKDLTFWLTHDSTIDVPMMTQEKEFNYLENADVQILELPYAGDDLSMIILLPRKIDGLAELEALLTAENLRVWLASLQKRKVMVYVPRFRMDAQFSLKNTLELMGMPNPFQPGIADFSGIDGTGMLYISAVIHKAFVDVNEEGSEAAAATGVVIGFTSVPAAPTEFRADHPFIFLIREKASGSILFLGRLVDPPG
jgi:serpin B